MSKKQKSASFGKTLRTPVGRLVFPSLSRPRGFENNPPKYSSMLVCRPGPQLDAMFVEIQQVGIAAFGMAFTQQKEKFYHPIISGEDVMAKAEKASEALYSGNFRLLAKGAEDKEPPKCYLADKSLLPRRPGNEDDLRRIEESFYPGCYCRFAVTPFSFSVGKSIGVGLILKGVQFVKDGDRLGSADIESIFGEEMESDFEIGDETDVLGDETESGELNL